MSTETAIILSSFGGPRDLGEIEPFLVELLTDCDVIRTPLPRFFDRWIFKKVAQKRVAKIAKDYELIGGRSPLFEDIETIASLLREKRGLPVITFHRYLPATHAQFISEVETSTAERFVVIPMYPQFSYATTGSVARFFATRLSGAQVDKMEWVKSYAAHPAYVQAMQTCLRTFLAERGLDEKEVFFFFSAHGLPQKYVDQGDPYQHECRQTYEEIMKVFPKTPSLLAFQSKFGPGEWLRPYTSELSLAPHLWCQGKEHIVFVPLSFTSDHLETLYEIEHTYVSNIREKGLQAYRCPALGCREEWIEALAQLPTTANACNNQLIRTGSRWFRVRQTPLDVCGLSPCKDKTAQK